MTRTYFLRHPGHNSACLRRQLAAGIHIITPHRVLRVAVAALMEVQEITTTQDVLFLSVIVAIEHQHHAPRRAVVSENVMTVTAAIGACQLIVAMNCQLLKMSSAHEPNENVAPYVATSSHSQKKKSGSRKTRCTFRTCTAAFTQPTVGLRLHHVVL